jgi:hypothetical protein
LTCTWAGLVCRAALCDIGNYFGMAKAPAVSHVEDPAMAFDDRAVSDSDFAAAFLATVDESSNV